MHNSKKGLLPFKHEIPVSKEQCPKTFEDEQCMKAVPYASAVGSLKRQSEVEYVVVTKAVKEAV